MKSEQVKRAVVFCALVALAVAVRLISETPNFNAVTAAALFAGFYFRSRVTAICVPLAAMMLSDLFLGGYEKHVMVAVYGSMLIPIAWRSMLRAELSVARVGLGALASSLAFYVLTNGAVWYAWYPHSATEFVHCYAVALPFFANGLAGDALFTTAFFGSYALIAWAKTISVPAASTAASVA